MKKSLRGVELLLVWALLTSAALAQDIEPNALANAGMQVIGLIEQGKLGDVWDGASQVAKKTIARQKFITELSKTLTPLGRARQREWMALTKTDNAASGPAGAAPVGRYATAEFQTDFASGKRMREVVSLRYDEDKTWRFTGYFVR